ncbi:MAG: hypothetical protein ACJAYY_001172 [Paraglaciecola sp.]|jgi:hypothetical protein
MEFKRRFGKQKESKPKKGIVLVLLLALALFLWFKAEPLLNAIF